MVGTNSYISKLKARLDQAIIQRDHWKQLAENRNSIVVTEVCPESRSVEEYIVGADNVRALWRLMREYRERIAALEAECERLRKSVTGMVIRQIAKQWDRVSRDAELEQYLSDGIAQLEAERDCLKSERDYLSRQLDRLIDQTTPLRPDATNPRWAERIKLDDVLAERDALAAELAAIKGQSGFDYSIRTQSTNSIPAPATPAVDIGRNAAFKACPDTGCDWSSFYRGWNAALAASAKESQQ